MGQIDDHLYALRLARGFAALAALTTGLIVLGALVRAHGAGLACPDWPLCFGELVPRFDVRIGFEWSHRAIAGSVGLIFLALAALALRREATRRASAAWLAAGALLFAVQVVLGALTVWELLASWTVTSHLVTGNALNASLILISRRLYDAAAPPQPRDPVAPALATTVSALALLLAVQLALGGLVSSKFLGLACNEWPTCAGGEWFPGFAGGRAIHLWHRLVAYGLVVTLPLAALLGRRVPRLRGLLTLAAALGLVQAAVGAANVLLRIPVEVTGLHSFLAACLVIVMALCLYEVWAAEAPTARTRPARY